MNLSKRNIGLIVLAILFVAAGIWLFGIGNGSDTNTENRVRIGPQEGEVSVIGTIICLPPRNPVGNIGCVKGLEAEDGTVYALNTVDIGWIEEAVRDGQEVEAVGELEAANPEEDESSIFLYDAVIVVRFIR